MTPPNPRSPEPLGLPLVTGAGGLVGGALLRAGARGLARSELDICDSDALARALDRLQPAAVINAAAQARVDLAEREPEISRRVNAEAPGLLARRCAERGLRLLHLSTDYALSGPDQPGLRLDEAWPSAPRSTYARHKVQGEEGVLEAGGLVVRVQWVYDLQGTSFLPTMLGRLRRGERLRLVVDQVGCPTPADLLAPRLLAAAAGGPTGLFHLATEGEARPWDWVQEAAALLGIPFRAEAVLRSELGGAERPARSCLDSRRFAERWGGLPGWREALAELIARRG